VCVCVHVCVSMQTINASCPISTKRCDVSHCRVSPRMRIKCVCNTQLYKQSLSHSLALSLSRSLALSFSRSLAPSLPRSLALSLHLSLTLSVTHTNSLSLSPPQCNTTTCVGYVTLIKSPNINANHALVSETAVKG